MSKSSPMPFQEQHIRVLVDRFLAMKRNYDALGPNAPGSELELLRKSSACVMLQAPTGIGKTLMACETLSRFSPEEQVLWFWFAPFAGVIAQSKAALKAQAPGLTHLDIEADRQALKLTSGGIFVLTWQTVAARSKDSRLARQTGDAGLGLDDLVQQARLEGYRIGVVVDEAHHGFVKATESSRFFADVLAPDYVLLMTATPRDNDAALFAKMTGYQIGGPSDWASVTRAEGVSAQLLKRSVKAAKFIARNQDDAQLLEFEEVALAECAVMHRLIKKILAEAGIKVVPLMLVQVPNGGTAIEKARQYLTGPLRFTDESVRVHSSDEPDPNLLALANDPAVEVIVFKMAIATGFDAPRAFTLAALRGARDTNFGIQVVGRIMRVHKLMQGRLDSLPALLHYGYVFLANSEAQEGLLTAAEQINKMPEQLASASPSTVITIIANDPMVQVLKPGETLSLLPRPSAATNGSPQPATPENLSSSSTKQQQVSLFEKLAVSGGASSVLSHGFAETSALIQAFELDATKEKYRYPRKAFAPKELISERLPATTDDFEKRLAAHIDFSKVLGDRMKVRSKVTERLTDVFTGGTPEDHDIWATYSAVAIAGKARQIAFTFEDADRRALLQALKARFREALTNEGHELPSSEDELTRQLELVLVRNDQLIKVAHKRLRAEEIVVAKAYLPEMLESLSPLTPAKRSVYGAFPETMSPQELEFAELLDTSEQIDWWYRNPAGAHRADAVGLYRWSGGTGFFPDFAAKVIGREEANGIALLEVKGPHLQHFDRAKANARHVAYGRVPMVGKAGADGGFRMWRLTEGDDLVDDGPFEVARLFYS